MLSELKEVKYRIVGNKAKGQVCFKKTNYMCVSGVWNGMFISRKIWRVLFSWNTCFEIQPFALLPTKYFRKKFGWAGTRKLWFATLTSVPSYNKFFDSTTFPKTRTQFLCYNIAWNEEDFGVLLFNYILKTKKLYLKWFKTKVSKVTFFKSFFDDSGDILYFEQTEICHIFHVACFNYLVWNP